MERVQSLQLDAPTGHLPWRPETVLPGGGAGPGNGGTVWTGDTCLHTCPHVPPCQHHSFMYSHHTNIHAPRAGAGGTGRDGRGRHAPWAVLAVRLDSSVCCSTFCLYSVGMKAKSKDKARASSLAQESPQETAQVLTGALAQGGRWDPALPEAQAGHGF